MNTTEVDEELTLPCRMKNKIVKRKGMVDSARTYPTVIHHGGHDSCEHDV